MKPDELLVRCMVRRDGDLWIASSIDFGLAAQAFSLEEAKEKLHSQLRVYVLEALTIDRVHAETLLGRRAPFQDRIAYAALHAIENRPRLRRSRPD